LRASVEYMQGLPQKLGIVAGGGVLPQKLAAFCEEKNIDLFIIGFDGHVLPETLSGRNHKVMRLGEAGSIIKILKEKAFNNLVIIGSVKRPKLTEMRPDLRTAAFFAKLGMRALGDDGLLKAVRAELEEEGFTIHGIQEIMPELIMTEGVLGTYRPDEKQIEDIRLGMAASRKIGEEDIGQSVVVLNGKLLGTEDESGTDALIRRAAAKGAILVKSSKPQQDRKLDMPTIGPETVRLCSSLGYAGIAAEAGGVLMADREEMIELANAKGLFLVGVSL
jgi:DUF1009 family protein